MMFGDDSCVGKAVMHRKPMRTTDGHGDSSIPPPNFIAGIMREISLI